MEALTHRPCGACGRLVPVSGCRHWRPRPSAGSAYVEPKWKATEREAKRQAAERVADFRRWAVLSNL